MQTVDLNIIPGAVIPVVNISQYDVGRQYALRVLDGNSVASLTGYDISVEGKKSDGHIVEYTSSDRVNGVYIIQISGNVVTITTTMQMTAAPGKAQMKLKLSKSGNTIHTMKYYLDCDSDPENDGDPSGSELPDIIAQATEQMNRAESAADRAEAVAETISDEAARAEAAAGAASTSASTANSAKNTAIAKASEAVSKANEASASATSANDNALKSEGHAVGQQNGTDVGSTSPYYHNNSKYYSEQAKHEADRAAQAAEFDPEDYVWSNGGNLSAVSGTAEDVTAIINGTWTDTSI